jgi:hypothetical protein
LYCLRIHAPNKRASSAPQSACRNIGSSVGGPGGTRSWRGRPTAAILRTCCRRESALLAYAAGARPALPDSHGAASTLRRAPAENGGGGSGCGFTAWRALAGIITGGVLHAGGARRCSCCRAEDGRGGGCIERGEGRGEGRAEAGGSRSRGGYVTGEGLRITRSCSLAGSTGAGTGGEMPMVELVEMPTWLLSKKTKRLGDADGADGGGAAAARFSSRNGARGDGAPERGSRGVAGGIGVGGAAGIGGGGREGASLRGPSTSDGAGRGALGAVGAGRGAFGALGAGLGAVGGAARGDPFGALGLSAPGPLERSLETRCRPLAPRCTA